MSNACQNMFNNFQEQNRRSQLSNRDERYVDESKEMSILNNEPADSDRSDGEADE